LTIPVAFAALGDSLKIAKQDRQSSFVLMSKDNQQLQNDMSINPALFSLLEGEQIWNTSENKQAACVTCHQALKGMKGVAGKYPKMVHHKLTTLEDQVNACRIKQNLKPFDQESPQLLAITTFLSFQSRGEKIAIQLDKTLKEKALDGERIFNKRMGQINLSCAQCHEERAGGLLGGVTIPQGHPNAYPIYRLEWQSMGSLQRRLRNCMIGVRAEPFAYGSEEFKELELFLKVRAQGMTIESPGVRP
jgi:sulfur-oxidizing protein SoxA